MKVKNLKSYNSYKELHIKENMAKFDASDENLEEIKEDSEEIESIDEPCETCNQEEKVGLGTEEEKKVDNLPVIAHVEIATEVEIPVKTVDTLPETLPISEPINTLGFNPNQNTDGFNPSEQAVLTDDASALKLFSIVRIMTQNGEKIGMCYTEEVGDYGTPIHNNIDFNSACALVKQTCTECGVEEFRSDLDKIIGNIPTFMIPKKTKGLGNTGTTSYIPN